MKVKLKLSAGNQQILSYHIFRHQDGFQDELKQFIKDTLAKQRKEIVEKLRMEKNKIKLDENTIERFLNEVNLLPDGNIFKSDCAYILRMLRILSELNQAVDEINKKLEEVEDEYTKYFFKKRSK